MTLPGLTFEIVRAPGPVLGLRTDRTALIALTERGPCEAPVLVHSHDEFVERFGCPLIGALGPLAAQGYFDNGGAELIVARFTPKEAAPAQAELDVVGATAASSPLPIEARDKGAFGNAIEIEAVLTVRRRGRGTLTAQDKVEYTSIPFTSDDVGLPVRVIAGTPPVERWGTVQVVSTSTPPQPFLQFTPALGGASLGDPALVEVYEPTFSLRITEPMRPMMVVSDLDLANIADANERLAATPIAISSPASYTGFELPKPGRRTRLSGGKDGLDGADIDALAASFRRCVAALEESDLPDLVIAPDLWSRIYQSKGKTLLAFDAATANALAEEMVQSVARTRDRIVLLDPPLSGAGDLRPSTAAELLSWSDGLEQLLGPERDFAAAFTPWVRIVAGGTYRGDDTLLVPPSAYVAGRMARTSRERGPWIATGNVSLERVIGLADTLSQREEEDLQALGISPLRVALPQGATLQGVRGLSYPDRKPWGYLSTRRLFNYLRRALRPIGLSYTFEPNAPATWIALRRDIVRLLRELYDRGAFAGARPEEAFFVKIDDVLNPEQARSTGVMTAQIGVAPAVPLEFLIVELIVQGGVARLVEESL